MSPRRASILFIRSFERAKRWSIFLSSSAARSSTRSNRFSMPANPFLTKVKNSPSVGSFLRFVTTFFIPRVYHHPIWLIHPCPTHVGPHGARRGGGTHRPG